MGINLTRRAALVGALVSSAALAVPATAALASRPSGKAEALIDAHKAAMAELSAAYEVEDAASNAFFAATDADPVTVELPGLKMLPHDTKHIGGKTRFAVVNARQMSQERVGEIYAHYDFYSRRGGAQLIGGKFVPIDLSADRSRDEAAALANLNAAFDRLRLVANATGKTAADERVADALDAVELSWMALLTHTPRTEEDGTAKSEYLAGCLAENDLAFDTHHLAALIASIDSSK